MNQDSTFEKFGQTLAQAPVSEHVKIYTDFLDQLQNGSDPTDVETKSDPSGSISG